MLFVNGNNNDDITLSSGNLITHLSPRIHVDTRKLLTMHGAFSTNSDIDGLYIPRRNGERGLISVWFTVEHEKRNLSYYFMFTILLMHSLMRLVARSFPQYQEDAKNFKKSIISEHLSRLSDKPLHGQFLRETANTIFNTSQ